MATLTSLLNLSTNALLADQSALNVTANNVANQNTVGYTREVVNFQELDSVLIGSQSVGQGVSTGVGATSVRDRVLEQRVQQQTQTAAQSGTLSTALAAADAVFGLSSTTASGVTTTLGAAVNSFFNSFSTLVANPSDTSTRQSVLSAASSLSSALNAASSQLAGISSGLDSNVSSLATQVNTLTSTIATLNQKIATGTSAPAGSDAGVLEDQRQAAIASLSQLIGVDQSVSENNGITLTTANGAALVSGVQSYALQTTVIGGVTHVLAGVSGTDITATLTGGSLGGTLQARDKQLATFSSQLDQLAYGIGTAVNTQNEAGLDGNGAAGAALFTLPTSAAGAASAIAVATTDPQSVAAAAVGEGATGNDNATALAALASGAVVGSQSPSGFFASFLAQLGNTVSAASSDNTVQQAVLTQLTSQRDAISGVSLDTEAANLTQYQRSYQAAAKVFSIVDELLADAINLGVESAVS